MRCRRGLVAAGVAFGLVAPGVAAQGPPPDAGTLTLTFDAGRVTLIATGVPVSTVLDEWAQLGRTTFVDAGALARQRVWLQLIDVPEAKALDLVLQDAAGYVAAPRAPDADHTGSRFDRVLVLVASRPAPARVTATRDRSAPGRALSLTPQPARPAAQGPFADPAGARPCTPEAFGALDFGDLGDLDDLDEEAIETLRSLLPRMEPGARQTPTRGGATGNRPGTAPRPGMPVGDPSRDEGVPVFIRPAVPPQPQDP